jgi:hypothetical protein
MHPKKSPVFPGRSSSEAIDYFTEPERRGPVTRRFQRGYELPPELKHQDGHVTPVLYNASVYR